MFGRFGSEARQLIAEAEEHARALTRDAVGPEHLLLALLAADRHDVFARAGLRFDEVRDQLVEVAAASPPPSGTVRAPRTLPLRLREVLRTAFRHAAFLGAPEVRPLHLALALVEDPPGEVRQLLRKLDIPSEDARRAVLDAFEEQGYGEPADVVPLTRRSEPRIIATPARSTAAR